MIAFKQSATINAPRPAVFAVVADPKRIPEWRTDVPAISGVSGETKVGTTFIEEVHFLGSKQLHMKVAELVPGEKLVLSALGGMPMLPTQSFTFTDVPGGTRIDLSVVMHTSGFFTMMQFVLPAQLKKIWEKYFENLNALLAGGASKE